MSQTLLVRCIVPQSHSITKANLVSLLSKAKSNPEKVVDITTDVATLAEGIEEMLANIEILLAYVRAVQVI